MLESNELPRINHTFASPAAVVESYLTSFPGGGFFLPTTSPFNMWTRFRLRFNLPPDEEFIDCVVEVLWINGPGGEAAPGMGVHFVDISPDDRARLDDYLKRWGRRDDVLDGRLTRLFPLEEAEAAS